MKEIQKKMTIIIWFCSVLIVFFEVLNGYSQATTTFTAIGVFTVSIFATIIYFIPMPERFKAVLILLTVGVATLGVSIALGGISGTFITSFLVLGMSVLYFDPAVLLGYSMLYLPICLIVYMVKPIYIVGKDMESYMGVILMFTYVFMTISLYIATRYGNQYMQKARKDEDESREQAVIIEKQTDAANQNTVSLFKLVGDSETMVEQLWKEANHANDNINHLRSSEEGTITTFHELSINIKHSTQWIEENYQLIENLKENYDTALQNVTDSKRFSNHARTSMDEIAAAIRHAFDCITRSSEEIKRIETIVNDMSAIASQTNLLAINASIEAARVGEQGAGFTIVAQQIRELSVRSKSASENINKILQALYEALLATETKVSNGITAIAQGIHNLEQMANGIEHIDRYSNQSQLTLNQEMQVFEQIKDEFASMVQEVNNSMHAAQKNMSDLKAVVDSIQSQTNRTMQVSKHLGEMGQLANQIKEHFTTSDVKAVIS